MTFPASSRFSAPGTTSSLPSSMRTQHYTKLPTHRPRPTSRRIAARRNPASRPDGRRWSSHRNDDECRVDARGHSYGSTDRTGIYGRRLQAASDSPGREEESDVHVFDMRRSMRPATNASASRPAADG
jgi:hypothetical protein